MFLSRSETGQEMFWTDITMQRGVGESMLIIPISIPSEQDEIVSFDIFFVFIFIVYSSGNEALTAFQKEVFNHSLINLQD